MAGPKDFLNEQTKRRAVSNVLDLPTDQPMSKPTNNFWLLLLAGLILINQWGLYIMARKVPGLGSCKRIKRNKDGTKSYYSCGPKKKARKSRSKK